MENRYAGKVKSEGEPNPAAIAEAWVGVWLRRIENSLSPEEAMKELVAKLHSLPRK